MSDSALKPVDRKSRLAHELKKFLIATLYLWLVFELFAIYRAVLLKEHGVDAWEQTFAIINALIFAKVILTVQLLGFSRRFKDLPIIYTGLGNALVFAIAILLFQVAEEGIKGAIKGEPFTAALAEVGEGTFVGILTAGTVFFLSLLPFSTFQEIARVLGAGNVSGLLFARDKKSYELIHR